MRVGGSRAHDGDVEDVHVRGGGGCGCRFSVHAKLGHIEQRPPRAVRLPLMGREGGWKVWDCSWF